MIMQKKKTLTHSNKDRLFSTYIKPKKKRGVSFSLSPIIKIEEQNDTLYGEDESEVKEDDQSPAEVQKVPFVRKINLKIFKRFLN